MFFLNQKFARDEQATAGSAVAFASAESSEVASAAAIVRDFGESGEEEASPAARVRGCVPENRRLTSHYRERRGKSPFLRPSLVPGVPDL